MQEMAEANSAASPAKPTTWEVESQGISEAFGHAGLTYPWRGSTTDLGPEAYVDNPVTGAPELSHWFTEKGQTIIRQRVNEMKALSVACRASLWRQPVPLPRRYGRRASGA